MVVLAICPFQLKGQVVYTIAGNGLTGYSGDGGPAAAATFDSTTTIARDAAGNIYINDQFNYCVRKIHHSTGIITTVAGNGTAGFSGDGGLATNAKLHTNWGIAVDGPGNIYIADQTNKRIRKVNTSGIITTIAGDGTYGKGGDGGPAVNAQFMRPVGIALDAAGNIYVGDQNAFNIRKITPSGIISTVAGFDTFGYSGDGGLAIYARLGYTYGLHADNAGNLYICDAGSGGNSCIRKVDAAGIITTVAGNGTEGYNGDNIPATSAWLNRPTGVFIDNAGNMIIADGRNERIRKVNRAGIITTICGTGVTGFNRDSLAATATQLYRPVAAVVDDSGKIFFTDMDNARVRVIHKVLSFYNGRSQHADVCENGSIQLDSLLAVVDRTSGKTDLWTVGTPPVHGSLSFSSFTQVSSGGYNLPVGLAYSPNMHYTGNDSFVINVTNGLDTSFTKVYLTVKSALTYPGVIEGPSSVCVAASITLTNNEGGGTWSASNLNAVVSNGVVTGQSGGSVTITYTLTNVCGSVFTTKTLTVYALPDAGKISGDSLLCIGQTVTLSETLPGGTWSVSNTNAGITTTGVLTGLKEGRDTVRYTIFDGTCTNRATYVVTIDAIPSAQIVTGRTEFCVGDTTIITGIPEGGLWIFANSNAVLSGNVITGITAGDDTISYIYANHCGIDTATTYITIYPMPHTPNITQNEGIIYVADSFAAYQWIFNGTPIAGAKADTYNVAATGDYSITVMNQFGCTATSPQLKIYTCNPDDLGVYPNPVESIVSINWCKPVTIRVLCLDGKEISIKTSTSQADFSGLPNGVYLLTFFDEHGNKIKTKMIVKNNKRY
jgi:sugar lactone lactonase YvrE